MSTIEQTERLRAVVFDLYGTLIASPPRDLWRRLAVITAAVLDADVNSTFEASQRSVSERMRGDWGDAHSAMQRLAEHLGANPAQEVVDRAVNERTNLLGQQRVTPIALKTIRALRRRGLRVGVLSNCLPETVLLWPELGLMNEVDAVSLSPSTRLLKPDPAAFSKACGELAVVPRQAAYVGDGGDCELTAAETLGFQTLRIKAGGQDLLEVARRLRF